MQSAHHSPGALRPTRLGLVLFLIYVACYAAFVVILLQPQPSPAAGTNGPSGIPLSVLWGFGLIAAAWVLALIYAFGTKADLALSHEEAN
jgi:uncharacterized membrane protein (DUF485 family)